MQKLIKTKEIKDVMALSYKFLSTFRKYLQNLKYNVKKVYIFHLILVVILSILILSIKKRGDSPFMEFPGAM